jgi:hypothetical protein
MIIFFKDLFQEIRFVEKNGKIMVTGKCTNFKN